MLQAKETVEYTGQLVNIGTILDGIKSFQILGWQQTESLEEPHTKLVKPEEDNTQAKLHGTACCRCGTTLDCMEATSFHLLAASVDPR